MIQDFRFALRSLLKTPGFTLVAVLTLALGIGASTAMFSLVNRVLLRPLALTDPDRLVFLREHVPVLSASPLAVNAAHYQTWRDRAHSFTELGIASPAVVALHDAGVATPVALTHATASFLPALGLAPALGRTFTAEDERGTHGDVVLLSDRLWRTRFQADRMIVGRTVLVDRKVHTVVGVLPPLPAFASLGLVPAGYSEPDLLKPMTLAPEELADKWGRHNYAVFARLRPGVTADAARRELDALAVDIAREAGEKAELRGVVTPLHERVVGHSRRSLLLLAGSVAAVLLIGCGNLAGLLLARAEQRRPEMSLRTALGASPGRVFRLALLEPLLVAALGGLGGLFLADTTVSLLPLFAPASLPRLGEVALDGTVTLFALLLTLACGLLAGLAPAWQLARRAPGSELGAGGRTLAGSHRTGRSHRLFVTVQTALSVVLLACAGLLAHSFHRLIHADQGFQARGALATQVILPADKYDTPERRVEFYDRLLGRLAGVPEFEAAAISNKLPLQGETWVDKIWVIGDGRTEAERPSVNTRMVSPGYFRALGLPLLGGRTFRAGDDRVETVVISSSLARVLWPGQDPVGRRLTRNGENESVVVGVVADVRADADRNPVPTIYRPFGYWAQGRTNLIVRPRGAPEAAVAPLRAAVRSVDPEVPLTSFQTLADIATGAVSPQRFQTSLIIAFAVVATLLTALGLYGIVAYAVACRRKEFGVRLALGATPDALPAAVVREYLRPVILGLGAGVLGYLATGRLLEGLLFQTNPRDPWLLAAVALLVVLVSALAAWLPARRAAKVDPMVALRAE
ncbi:MAG: ABC transporter permease [Opitutae bacterium]|nr:ABC transporter permease [Opitutae bacterium]